MQTADDVGKKLIEQAIAGEATAAKLIPASGIAVAQWVRHKCQFGCRHFGKRFTCPPYAPTPEETADTVKDYEYALIVEFRGWRIDDRDKGINHTPIHKLLFELERQAFLDGLHQAIAYAAGPCHLCKECPAEKLEEPSLFHKKDCLNPKMARPSMEAAGIDVYKTARQAGFEIHVVREKSEPYTSFGLVLLE